MNAIVKKRHLFGATMLVTGCCIGAGMIGLPVVSRLSGFMPSVIAMLVCYLFTTITGLLLLEATLWFDTKVNLPSIAEYTLGKFGKLITIFLFLFLFYSLFVAYLDAGGNLFAGMLSSLFNIQISHTFGVLLCMGFVFLVSYAGTIIVDGFNRAMLLGMVLSYCFMLILGLPKVTFENLTYANWNATLGVVPVLLICFGYQNLVPTITYYLDKNTRAIRLAIIIGNLIPFFIYFIWDYVILGMLSVNNVELSDNVAMVTELLQNSAVSSFLIVMIIKSFSLFAMLTSFLPSTVSFADFLKDAFVKVFNGSKKSNLLIHSLIFIPTSICALVYPRIFLEALSFAGGFIDVLLYGVLPAVVVLVGRKMKSNVGCYQVFGRNITPIFVLLFSGLVLFFKLGSL